ncbi:MAG: twin-arginine translocase TatA/TatE family subunit [Dehalococcoidia bacterium]|nr:twin-arginine translocase TatA/TatE family subunit [Dehalococcoidia bacterium]
MPDLGVPELLIIAAIVLLLFGPGKAADIGGSLGRSIREFRKATQEDERPNATPPPTPPAAAADVIAPTADVPAATARRCCDACGAGIGEAQRFCTTCGAPVAAAAGAP